MLWSPVCGKIPHVEGLAVEVSQPGHAWGLIVIIVAVAFVVVGGAYCFCSSRSNHRPDEKAALAFAGSVQQPPSGGIYQKRGAASAAGKHAARVTHRVRPSPASKFSMLRRSAA